MMKAFERVEGGVTVTRYSNQHDGFVGFTPATIATLQQRKAIGEQRREAARANRQNENQGNGQNQ